MTVKVSLYTLHDRETLAWAQRRVTKFHYLHRPVDPRCSVFGYAIGVCRPSRGMREAGLLLFGRPEATRCGGFYGSVEDQESGRAECTRWQVLNLARVWIDPMYQFDPDIDDDDSREYCQKWVPGFTDRKGVFRSTLASTAINMAMDRVVVDYLLARPPCFPDEPYQLEYCLSYCDTNLHKGIVYKASGFELYRTNGRGIQTWRKRLRPLTPEEDAAVLLASERSERSRRYRAARGVQQLAFL